MFIKKFSSETKKVLSAFVIWRVALFAIALLAIYMIPSWGGRYPYWDTALQITKLPSWIWSFGGFDGVHYLRIAQDGYASANYQTFFPLYPLLIRFLNFFSRNPLLDLRIFVDPSYFYTGLILANAFFVLGLYYFYKLLRLDFNKRISFWSLILLLAFPTSYYFGAIYTESLFLFLAAGSIYSTRKHNFLLAGALAGLASATRILGLMLLPLIIIEFYLYLRSTGKIAIIKKAKACLGVAVAPLGAVLYMIYLKATTGDYLYFLTAQPSFGAERSAQPFILLPQVVYRYLKIFLTVPLGSLNFFNAGVEFVFALGSLLLLVIYWKKMRLSYWIFTFGCLIIPTLTGTFSSMPRYALLGLFILPFVARRPKLAKALAVVFVLFAVILISLFTRGYWVG